jgi:hypothetical protein
MGSGNWNKSTFTSYVTSTSLSRGYTATVDSLGSILTSASNQDMFKAKSVDPTLNPKRVMRECKDSDEHPRTLPIILCVDVSGSMGQAAVEVAKKLNVIMTKLYDKGDSDVEFMIMGIGDLYCDNGPIQISQFESDIRIAEQLDKLWFEFGGGGNLSESYSAAWYMGSRHCKLDCWKRGQKGIIITMGDERCNPYLPMNNLQMLTGDTLQADVESMNLYDEASQKFDIYHIQVNHGRAWDLDGIKKSWEFLGDNYREANMDNIADVVIDIIVNNGNNSIIDNNKEISW